MSKQIDFFGNSYEKPDRRRVGPRPLGPVPEIPKTGWKPLPPSEWPNIRHAKAIALDTETFDPELTTHGPGWARNKGHVVGVSVAVRGGKWYFPIRHELEPELNLDPTNVLLWLNWSLGGDSFKIGANLKYDLGWLKHEGVECPGKLGDVQIAEALINETSKVNLDGLGVKYLNRGKTAQVLAAWAMRYYRSTKREWRKDIYRCPVSMVGPYAEDDAAMPLEILAEQWPELVRRGLMPLFEMENKLTRLLQEMRWEGVQIDVPFVEQLEREFLEKIEIAEAEADAMVGMQGLNVDSSEDLATAFKKLGLPIVYTPPSKNFPQGQPSFTKDVLTGLTDPFGLKVNEIRGLKKLVSTFLRGGLLNAHVKGKVYTTFNQVSGGDDGAGGARTGRLASQDPNLQNIPVRSADGKRIRQAFIMDYGHLQVRDYDYSQIEYRMLAHFATGAGADEVRALYNENPKLDYHDLIGDMIYAITGVRLLRSYVKNINFGLVYGLGIDALAMYLKTTVAHAMQLTKSFHSAVPFAQTTMDDISDDVRRTGIVATIMNRQSHFDLWEPVVWKMRKGTTPQPFEIARHLWGTAIDRAYLYRALNYKLQGSAADVMKMGMVKAYEDGVFNITGIPRLTVHDELFFSEPHGVPQDAWDHLQHIFETCLPTKVPLRFDCGVGANWGAAH